MAEIITGASAGAKAFPNSARALPHQVQIIGKPNPRRAKPATIKSPPQRSSWVWRMGNLAAASAALAPSTMAMMPRIRNTVASVYEVSRSVIRHGGKDSVSPRSGALIFHQRVNS